MTLVAIIILSILFLSLVIGVSYNSFIHRKNVLQYAYHGLEAMVKKRHDLIPKLVEVVQSSAQFESRLIQQTNELLAYKEIKSLPAAQLAKRENEMAQSITQITNELRQDAAIRQQKSFMHLQKALVETEEQISAARRAYNAAAMEYNNAIEMFPTSLFANLLQYERVDPMELTLLETDYEEAP